MKQRNRIFDIVKGIGIISIVIGHATSNKIIHEYTYLYHLVIFYFVASFFYNEKKWGDNPFGHLGKRIKGVWFKYFFYSSIIVLLHNLFIDYNFYNCNTIKYLEINDILSKILNSTFFISTGEQFCGALWFIPTLVFGMGLFGGVVYISKKISSIIRLHKINNKEYIKHFFIILFCVSLGWLGVYLIEEKIKLASNIHISFLIMPIFLFGYFIKIHIDKLKKIFKMYITIPVCIFTSVLLLYFIIVQEMNIELAHGKIINGYMFYIVSLVGICFCLCLAKIINRIPIINKFIELCGKYSFSIMALHFACIKLVDVIYSKIINETDPEIISKFVTSYPGKIWLVYVAIGCILPLIFALSIDFIKKIFLRLNNKILMLNERNLNE